VRRLLQRGRGRRALWICADDRRDPSVLCVVEDPRDIVSVERTGEFSGRYHVLGGALNRSRASAPSSSVYASCWRVSRPTR